MSLRLAEVITLYGERIRLSALKAKSEAITNASVKAEERKLEIEDRLVQILNKSGSHLFSYFVRSCSLMYLPASVK